MRKLAVLTLLLVLCAALAALPAAAAPGPDVIAHRGASRSTPENTVTAIAAALRAGADLVEVDVRMTADRELVLLHDRTLSRTTDVERRYPSRAPWRVGEFTLAEIRTLDAGRWMGAVYAGESVPTLAEALAAVRGRAGLLVELKNPQRDLRMEALLAEQLSSDGTATGVPDPRHQVVVQSFDYLAVARFAALQPTIPVAVLTRDAPSPAQLGVYATFADQVAPPHRVVDRKLVAEVQRHGLRIAPYTVNDRGRMRRLLRWGVDGLVTDVPARLRRVRAASVSG